MKKYKISLIAFLLILLSVQACSNDSLINSTQNKGTVRAEDIRAEYEYYLKEVKRLPKTVIDSELSKIKYDVSFYKVTYDATDPFGATKRLSGLVGIPNLSKEDKSKLFSIVSIQHGTLVYEAQAPSNIKFEKGKLTRDALTILSAAHTNGYIVVMPDYFGYGSDEENVHYYETGTSLAEATRKLIEAIPDLAKEKSVNIDLSKLFLFGYSEGGFATMSTLKSFSEHPTSYKNIITVSGAGAYDKVATAKHVTSQKGGNSPQFTASYLWVLLTYNSVYGINRDLHQMLLPAIVPKVKKYVGTDKIMQSQNIPSDPSKIFAPLFVEGLIKETDNDYIKALMDNNVSDFDALGSVILVHGMQDTWVPTFNTDSAFVRLQKRGVDVKTKYIEGGTHSSSYTGFIMKALETL
ncbi:S9 family peptidase [Dysgonomonas sp. BGC7]|uniref:alpha/beta hydrolase family protein n=1 Tax=Dysgonomonas sp. BGC7 TaxID=1658008 RepID=UPI00067FAF99|nr:lipase family protein [Dysgonomonas sp. BGC7]MBD8387104.1 hypothetical protein [Dysgonomonas sp. BGC7]